MAGAVEMEHHVVLARPLRHGLDGRVAYHQVDHHDDGAEVSRKFSALVHVLHRRRGDVEIGPLDFACLGLRLVDRLHAVEEAVAPMHEGLRVDVLVVFGEVEPALQRLVDDAAVVAAGQSELRLDRRAEQRPAELIQAFALDHDPGCRPLEGFHVGDRETHVFEPQCLQWLEAEDIADDRRREVGDRSRLEQVEIIGDIGEILTGRIRHGVDPIGLGPVFFAGREAVRPNNRPGGRGGFAGHGCCRLDGIDAFLGRDPEERDDIRVLRLIVRLPIAHLLVFHDARPVARGAGHGFGHIGHGIVLSLQKRPSGSLRGCGLRVETS